MKKIAWTILAICFVSLPFFSKAQQVIVTDDAAYTTPATGAMLDVNSVSKGFLPPRIALNSVTDQTTVASPTTGLIVYNNGVGTLKDKGMFYWNGSSWVKMLIGGSGGTNYLSIADDGTVILHGTATSWDDLRVDGSRVANSGASAPYWGSFIGNLYANIFENNKDQSVYFGVQMPHAWLQGSDLGAHVHWTTNGATGPYASPAPLGTKVVWSMEYQWVNIGENFSTSTNNTISGFTPLTTSNINADNSLAVGEHAITPIGTISGTGKNFSSVLVCRVTRLGSDVNDTYTGAVALLSIDFHYQIDSFGTSNEFSK